MNLQYISFFSFALIILGVFGTVISRRFLQVIISFQFLIIAALINFYSFSLFKYETSNWDKTFILISFITIYLLLFLTVFYNYSKQTNVYDLDVKGYCGVFKFERSDWWGEDNIDSN